jgi:hypothetical protein
LLSSCFSTTELSLSHPCSFSSIAFFTLSPSALRAVRHGHESAHTQSGPAIMSTLTAVLSSLAGLKGGTTPHESFLPTPLGNPRGPLPKGQGIDEFASCLQLLLDVVDDLAYSHAADGQLLSSSVSLASGFDTAASLLAPPQDQCTAIDSASQTVRVCFV